MTGELSQSPHWADAAAAAMKFVSQVEAEWQGAPKEQLLGWHERLSCGLTRIREAHARTEALANAGTLARSAVLDAYLRIAPTVIARLETLLTNIATRLDALAPAA